MGRPFASELQALDATYAWALVHPIEALSRAVEQAASGSLVPVGSGGSFTAASFAAALHERFAGSVSRAATPLGLRSILPHVRGMHSLFVSAGGRNKDVVDAMQALAMHDPKSVAVLCAAVGSPLAGAARTRCDAAVEEFRLPSGRDGFLATNSLLAFCVLLYRAYARVFAAPSLPGELVDLVGIQADRREHSADEITELLWSREVLIVLHGPDTTSAALDLESKFTEAALGMVQLADFRNFGHGRHHWLAKHGERTAVLALVGPADRELARRTLKLLPPSVPLASIDVGNDGPMASLSGLVHVYHISGSAGRARAIDPGRPGVPDFGSKLYSLRGPALGQLSSTERAIVRKRRAAAESDSADGQSTFWTKAHSRFVARLCRTAFGGVVLDYDGTLCDADARYGELDELVVGELMRLLSGGLSIGIATGRGVSVQKALRRAIPKALWKRLWVGYYNGGHIARLDEVIGEAVRVPREDLLPVVALLEGDPRLSAIATVTPRNPQVTVEPRSPADSNAVFALVQQRLACGADPRLRLVRSSHSLDILAPGVSKVALLEHLTPHLAEATSLLCIGDRGQFPGNDFALLATPYSLSVDEVSVDPESCWNLAPPGAKGSRATLGYLRGLAKRARRWRFDGKAIA